MKAHKSETLHAASAVMGYPPDVRERVYDSLMSKLSTDGKFEPHALATLRISSIDLKLLPGPINMTRFYTTRFLPKTSVV